MLEVDNPYRSGDSSLRALGPPSRDDGNWRGFSAGRDRDEGTPSAPRSTLSVSLAEIAAQEGKREQVEVCSSSAEGGTSGKGSEGDVTATSKDHGAHNKGESFLGSLSLSGNQGSALDKQDDIAGSRAGDAGSRVISDEESNDKAVKTK